MKLDAYVSAAGDQCEELADELHAHGLQAVSEVCEQVGAKKMMAHLAENYTAYLAAVPDTPSARRRKLRTMDVRDQIIYRLAVLFLARNALIVLNAVCDHQLEPGGPYRQTTARSAAAALQIAREQPSFWPFEDHPDPFEDA